MERAAITMPFLTTRPEKLGFGLLGLLQGQFRGDRDVSVQFGIELLDAGEHQLGELDGREFAFAKKFSDFLDGCEGQVGVVHSSQIKPLAGFASVADQPANLVGIRLLEGGVAERGIGIQAEVGNGGKQFPIRFYFEERADGDESLNLGIVLKNLLQIVEVAGSDFEIADDRRPVAGTESKCERRDGVERLEHVALAVDDGAAKGGIKVVLLNDAPGNELLRLAVAVFAEEPLRKAIFDFAGVGRSGIGIEMNKVGEMIHPGNVAVGEGRLDGVFVAASILALLSGSATEETFERRRANLDGELGRVAG